MIRIGSLEGDYRRIIVGPKGSRMRKYSEPFFTPTRQKARSNENTEQASQGFVP